MLNAHLALLFLETTDFMNIREKKYIKQVLGQVKRRQYAVGLGSEKEASSKKKD